MRALTLLALAVGLAVALSTVGCTSAESQCSLLVDEAVEQSSMEAFETFVGRCLSEDPEETVAGIDLLMGQISFAFVDADTKKPVSFPANLFWVHGDASEAEIAWHERHDLEIVDQGAGKFVIKNVLPGEYALLAKVPDYGYRNVAKVDVPPAKVVELGEIEVVVDAQ